MHNTELAPTLRTALGFHVTRLSLLLRRRLIRALADWKLTPEQWQVLVSIVELERELSQSDLAELTLRDRHAVSKMIDRMQRDGWIVRKPGRNDARAFSIEVSAKARRELPNIRSSLTASFSPVFERMPAARRARLIELVMEMIELFEEEDRA
jgi:DNA-binding MarR family transcriptional regulator